MGTIENLAEAVLAGSVLGNLMIGVIVLSRNNKDALHQLFFLFSLAVSSWATSNLAYQLVAGSQQYIIALVSYGAAGLLAVLFLLFAAELGAKRNHLLTHAVAVYASIVTAAAVLPNVVATGVNAKGVILTNAAPLALYGLGVVLALGLAVLYLFQVLKAGEHEARARIQLILIGLSTAAAVGLVCNLLMPLLGNYSLVSVGPSGSLVLVALTAYSIVRHGLFDIRSFVLRGAAYSLTTLMLAIMYIAPLILVLMAVIDLKFKLVEFIIATIFAVIVAAFYGRVRVWFDKVTNTIFFRTAYNPTVLLNEFNKGLVSTIDMMELLERSARVIRRNMRPEFCAFVVLGEGVRTNRIVGSGISATQRSRVDEVTRALSKLPDDVLAANAMPKRAMQIKESLVLSGVAVAIRLHVNHGEEKKTLGYMFLGALMSGRAYDMKDMQVIDTVADTLVIAMQNALHFEEIQRFNATLQDRVEEQTRKYRTANVKLKKLDETKDEFISMASHQLRTPLTSVKGYLSMVLEGDAGPLKPQQEQLLKQSYLSSQRMVNLIADLLNLSRLNTGKFVIDAQPTDLRMVVDQEVAQLRESAKAKNITLSWDMPTTFSILQLDEGKMHQVVMNFIDNAIYYTPENGTILVSLIETETAVEFRVKDSGIGVPRDQHRHLFTKFYRADNARRMRPDGTGLGLYMAKKVVVAQGGAILFESQEGKGSTFGFRFAKTKT